MSQIFVSHSRRDKNNDYFLKAFGLEQVKGAFMEYEDIKKPHWSSIKDNVANASSVFVLLTKDIKDFEHTQNWIAFEVGLACQLGKNVWVFKTEEEEPEINFAVPYFTDLVIYNTEKKHHFDAIREVIREGGLNRVRGIPMTCFNCGIWYTIYGELKFDGVCPCCLNNK